MPLKAIIFDYGGVLSTQPPEEQLRQLASLCGLRLDQFLEGYWGLRAAYDRAEIESRDYWREIGRRWDRNYTDGEIDEFRRGDVLCWVHLNLAMMDWARRVRAAGIRTGLLSNLPSDHAEDLRMNLVADFDHYTFSCDLRTAKPDAAIYRHELEGLGIEPGEAVFIDDRQENVDGARRVGLHAVRFESAEKLQPQLDEVTRLAGGFLAVGAPPVLLE